MNNEWKMVPGDAILSIADRIRFSCPNAAKELEQLIAAAPAEDVRAVGEEPVYQVRSHGSCCWEDIGGESLEVCRSQPEEYEIRTLYIHPQRPVVLPERKAVRWDIPEGVARAEEWNACLDAVEELNK